jgi:Transmembrane protein 33/Nucleoporin POM33
LPLVIHAFLQSGPSLQAYLARHSSPFIQNLSTYLRGPLQQKASLTELKADLEIYLGFYLLLVWLIGRSHIIAILMYWQLLRIKYMLGTATTQSFRRIDRGIKDLIVVNPWCPMAVVNGHRKVRE